MYINALDNKKQPNLFLWKSEANISWIFRVVRDFSYVAEGFVQSMTRRVDFGFQQSYECTINFRKKWRESYLVDVDNIYTNDRTRNVV